MKIVRDWTEFGHHFQIELLSKPVRKGAGDRPYRLWCNGQPATGGQWHYSIDNAVARAEYLLQCSYSSRIRWLEQRIAILEAILADGPTKGRLTQLNSGSRLEHNI